MRKRIWVKQRHLIETPDALRRWDQFYQYLLQWAVCDAVTVSPSVIQEVQDESSNLCPSIQSAADPDSND